MKAIKIVHKNAWERARGMGQRRLPAASTKDWLDQTRGPRRTPNNQAQAMITALFPEAQDFDSAAAGSVGGMDEGSTNAPGIPKSSVARRAPLLLASVSK